MLPAKINAAKIHKIFKYRRKKKSYNHLFKILHVEWKFIDLKYSSWMYEWYVCTFWLLVFIFIPIFFYIKGKLFMCVWGVDRNIESILHCIKYYTVHKVVSIILNIKM